MDSDKIKLFYTNLFNENFQANDQIIAENSQILKTSAKFSSKSVVEHGIDYEDPALLDFLMGSGDREEDEKKTIELVRQNFERQINLSKTGYSCRSSKSPNESGYRSFNSEILSNTNINSISRGPSISELPLSDDEDEMELIITDSDSAIINSSITSDENISILPETNHQITWTQEKIDQFNHFNKNYSIKSLILLRENWLQDQVNFNSKLMKALDLKEELLVEREDFINRLGSLAADPKFEGNIEEIVEVQTHFCQQ